MEKPLDFSRQKRFPGETGNPFDIFLHAAEKIEKIPNLIFLLIILIFSFLPTINRWNLTPIVFGFCLLDWLMLVLLPHFNKSFGPAKPPVFFLAIARACTALFPFYIAIGFQVFISIVVFYGCWLEPHRISVSYQLLIPPHWQTAKPMRLIHFGDLHIERITKREKDLIGLINRFSPDVIVFSGDILNLSYLRDPTAWQAARDFFCQLKAEKGVFLVTGSPAVDLTDIIPDLLTDIPVTWLRDEKVNLTYQGNSFCIIGLLCTQKPHVDGPKLDSLVEKDGNALQILLYHTPDLAPNASLSGIDLQLSGHTHGGQIRLPFWGALFTGSLYGKRFEAGRYTINNMTLYVTRGIGMEGAAAPRVRFLCPPELILWEIGGPEINPTSPNRKVLHDKNP